MPAKKKPTPIKKAPPAPIHEQPIVETLKVNYMPYAMSVIISRAIPEIDGFKPSQRKLLYTMYRMGLLGGRYTKSANVVGETMQLNPHGDAAIYETMVRLTRDYEALLHPFVDSKGSFGKHYSASTMVYAAPRYTEVRLEPFCQEIFKGIDKNAVDMVDNYDGTMKEPVLFPTTFPNLLVSPNKGIAVGMASDICSFNLSEICDGTMAMLKRPNVSVDRLMELIKAPDFAGGGLLLYDKEQMKNIYETGSGSFRMRARYRYDADARCIDILEIPYSTSIEQIMDKITALVKAGSLKEITDFRDEIDISGFKLTLDLRRGTDPEKLMAKLFRLTPLEDSFRCNFNILVDASPRQMGIPEILREWIRFRMECVRRELTFDLGKKRDKLHLLEALAKVLLDIDLAIRIIRKTEKEADVIPALMKGFSIDEIQANYIAEIKLRSLNREYILNRIAEMENLRKEIAEIEEILADELKIKALIASQLAEIKKKYGQPRKTQIIHADDVEKYEEEDDIENYPVKLMLTKEGYFKKIAVTPRSPFSADDQKIKEGDEIRLAIDAENSDDLVFFTDRCQVYRMAVSDFDALKSAQMGDYLPAKLNMDDGECPIYMAVRNDYPEGEAMIFLFENGKGVRVPVTAYQTKGNRRKLTGAYSDASPIVGIFSDTEKQPVEILMISSANRAILLKSSLIPLKTTRTSVGVQVFKLRTGQTVAQALTDFEGRFDHVKSYRKIKIPALGTLLEEKNIEIQQMKMDV